MKGAATLYTKEFFELAKSKLNPGGTVTLFVQLYESTPEAVKSEIGTFFEVFPNGVIWGNTHQGRGYDTVLMGTVEAPHFNVDEWEARLNSPQYAAREGVAPRNQHLLGASICSRNYAGRASDMKAYLADAQINRDRDLRLQYLAGLGIEPLSERADLRRHPAAQEVPGRAVQRIARDDGEAAQRHRERAGRGPAVTCLRIGSVLELQARVEVVVEPAEELGVDERPQHALADGPIEVPETLSLIDPQPQSWHFDEFASHAVEQTDVRAHVIPFRTQS